MPKEDLKIKITMENEENLIQAQSPKAKKIIGMSSAIIAIRWGI